MDIGNMIKQTKNVYDTTKAKELIDQADGKGAYLVSNITGLPSYFVFCKCSVNKSSSQRSTDWSDSSKYNTTYLKTASADMNVDRYGMYSGREQLDTTYERIFKPNDTTQYTETVTAYSYNNANNFDVNQVTTLQSNGDINYKNIKYSSDYNTGV